jgi:hypothetical protein
MFEATLSLSKPPENVQKIKVGFVYDTSFLMNNLKDPADKLHYYIFEFSQDIPRWLGLSAITERGHFRGSDLFDIVRVIPNLVIREIHNHFSDQAKEAKAKRARITVAKLIEKGACEVDISNTELIKTGDNLLSADSNTDKKIIAFALNQSLGQWHYSVIASSDGGIFYDSVNLRNDGKRIYCYTGNSTNQDEFCRHFFMILNCQDKRFLSVTNIDPYKNHKSNCLKD